MTALSPLAQRLANKMMQATKVSALPVRVKSRYDFIQATATANGFEKGNISKLASFLLKNKECSTWSESMSKAWELAKGRKAQFVSPKISDYSFFSKGN